MSLAVEDPALFGGFGIQVIQASQIRQTAKRNYSPAARGQSLFRVRPMAATSPATSSLGESREARDPTLDAGNG